MSRGSNLIARVAGTGKSCVTPPRFAKMAAMMRLRTFGGFRLLAAAHSGGSAAPLEA